MKKLEKALRRLNTKYMVDKMYKKAESITENHPEESKRKILGRMKIFFGPSRQFANVFKTALLFSVEQHRENSLFKFVMQREPLFNQILDNMVLGQSLALK